MAAVFAPTAIFFLLSLPELTEMKRWFGFGFNAFGQITVSDKLIDEDAVKEIKLVKPTELHSERSVKAASWSRRISLNLEGDRRVWLTGVCCELCVEESQGCTDAFLSESYLTLSFPDRTESWSLQDNQNTRAWHRDLMTPPDSPGLPLVPGGYIATKPPFFRSLSPHLKAKSLVLGAEHAILLSATGVVYTWGLGSHGQLGHGGLTSEQEPRAVEALWGMPMSCVATGGWHSVCISTGGDLYVWGWNESGQLGLPSHALRKAKQRSGEQTVALSQDASTPPEEDKYEDVFISIQPFPALVDISPSCEISTVSCGSRHTAAVTTTGDLYTWGWGDYGQLGHQTVTSSDEPQRVDFFREQKMFVTDVVCGAWNTFVAVQPLAKIMESPASEDVHSVV
ncbi:RCC1 domain-containing protein 1 isoform X2 [Thalassophryne amazonica]|uniref:RCC1 domain-containing protein 1 isoform X2 n=1 Tax=Thalassophryne amazonica TaxID=390379 RepID=UPI0014721A4C|nr:RCC1 domain-containing protein 1 isoform X2 [Thalassophryne amazonica]